MTNDALRLARYLGMSLFVIMTAFFGIDYYHYRQEMKDLTDTLSGTSKKMETSLGQIEYAIEGQGEPVLVIHGAGGGYDQGLLLAKTFTKDQAQLIAISRPGFLGTPLKDENKTPQSHAIMYKELLDKLGIKKVHVLAFSDGGPSAIQFAIKYPERCKSLTLAACKSKTPPQETLAQSLIFGNIFKADYLFWWVAKHQEKNLLKAFGISSDIQKTMDTEEKELVKDFIDHMQPMKLRAEGIYNEREQLKVLDEEDYDLSKISVKTLIIHAKDDSLQSYDYALYSADKILGSRLVSFETGGHMMIGHHQEIYDIFMDFIQ